MINTLTNEVEASHTLPKKTGTNSLEGNYMLERQFDKDNLVKRSTGYN
jgi:hypothetical protein